MSGAPLAFTVALTDQLPATGDLCWSPYSVSAALGLAAQGARGDTRTELVRALTGRAGGGDGTTDAHPGGGPAGDRSAGPTGALAASAALPDAEAAVANSLWLDRRLPVRPGYEQSVRDLPGGAVRHADFRRDPEAARAAINADVAETTRGLVRELIAAGMIAADTAAVIASALYLRVGWRYPFDPAATGPTDFHAPSGRRPVPTMRRRERLGYAAGEGLRMVTLPTASPAVVVDIVLPDTHPPAAADLRGPLATLWRTARNVEVDLALPRFRVGSRLVLNRPLSGLGVDTAFDPGRADFGDVTGAARIALDRVVHQALLRVDEQGLEGAAATGAVMRLVSMSTRSPVRFHVDRPFLVLVRHARTDAVLFLARVAEP